VFGNLGEYFGERLLAALRHIQKPDREASAGTAADGYSIETKGDTAEFELHLDLHHDSGEKGLFGLYTAAAKTEVDEPSGQFSCASARRDGDRAVYCVADRDAAFGSVDRLFLILFPVVVALIWTLPGCHLRPRFAGLAQRP
jgi:hypothetical protein